jgi:hypothetical protein
MRCYLCFIFGGLLLSSGCENKVCVTESNLVGAWRSINTHKVSDPPDDIIVYKRGNLLLLTTYYGHHRAELNETGDSLTLRQGCMVYLLPITLRVVPDKGPDTLSILKPGFGKFTRMDSSTFVENYLAYKRLLTKTYHTEKTKQ